MLDEQKEKIMIRLDQLYREIPLESCGYVLTAIQDIESIIYAADNMSDKGYEVGDLKDIPPPKYLDDIVSNIK